MQNRFRILASADDSQDHGLAQADVPPEVEKVRRVGEDDSLPRQSLGTARIASLR